MTKRLYDAIRAVMDAFDGQSLDDVQKEPLDALNELADELTDCGKLFQSNVRSVSKAAPELYELLSTIENDNGFIPEPLWERIQKTLARIREGN